MICERCWYDAESMGADSHVDAYRALLRRRKQCPCIDCPDCGGARGTWTGWDYVPCASCHGTGKVPQDPPAVDDT